MTPKKIFALFVAALLLTIFGLVGTTPVAAMGVNCTADPSVVALGTAIHISCTGFDRDVMVNSYVVEPTGFSEVGRSNYAVCMMGTRTNANGSAKTDESGTANFIWFTQDGSGNSPCGYDGYANQLGTYTVVVQQLDGKGGIQYAGKVQVTLTGNGETVSGAQVHVDEIVYSGDDFMVHGSGFAPNEYVNVWFTTPASCSGMAWWFYTGVSAFDPSRWEGAGVFGPGSIKTDENGHFMAYYSAQDHEGAYPCLGSWSVTARALGSGLGGEAQFTMEGKSIAGNASLWTDESNVPAIGQKYACWGGEPECGVAVNVHGSGFPANSIVNCWFTRPDGVSLYGLEPDDNDNESHTAFKVDGSDSFSGLVTSWTSDIGYQGEQPGTWHVSCGTPDQKYSGVASFTVYSLPFMDP